VYSKTSLGAGQVGGSPSLTKATVGAG